MSPTPPSRNYWASSPLARVFGGRHWVFTPPRRLWNLGVVSVVTPRRILPVLFSGRLYSSPAAGGHARGSSSFRGRLSPLAAPSSGMQKKKVCHDHQEPRLAGALRRRHQLGHAAPRTPTSLTPKSPSVPRNRKPILQMTAQQLLHVAAQAVELAVGGLREAPRLKSELAAP